MLCSLLPMTLEEETFAEKKYTHNLFLKTPYWGISPRTLSLLGNSHSSVSSLSSMCLVRTVHPPQPSMYCPGLWHLSVLFPLKCHICHGLSCTCMCVRVYHNICRIWRLLNIHLYYISYVCIYICIYAVSIVINSF